MILPEDQVSSVGQQQCQHQAPALHMGEIVRTNYGSGPYRIVAVDGPCTCRSYDDDINHWHSAGSQPHYHLTCVDTWKPVGKRRLANKYSYLNGYRHDGTNVWSDDYLIFPLRSQFYVAPFVLWQGPDSQ